MLPAHGRSSIQLDSPAYRERPARGCRKAGLFCSRRRTHGARELSAHQAVIYAQKGGGAV